MGTGGPAESAIPSPTPDAGSSDLAERAAAGEYDDQSYPNYPDVRRRIVKGVLQGFLVFEVAAALVVGNVLREGFRSSPADWASLSLAAAFAITGALVGCAGFRLTPYVISRGVLQYPRMRPLYRGTTPLSRFHSFFWLERRDWFGRSERDLVYDKTSGAAFTEPFIQTTIVVLPREGRRITVWPRSLASPEHFSQALRANGLVKLPNRYQTVTRWQGAYPGYNFSRLQPAQKRRR